MNEDLNGTECSWKIDTNQTYMNSSSQSDTEILIEFNQIKEINFTFYYGQEVTAFSA